jgi:NADH-quinone oxidoreductase subunit A
VHFFTTEFCWPCDIISAHSELKPYCKLRLMLEDYFRQYGLIAIFAAIAVLVPVGMLTLSYLAGRVGLRPNNPTPVKLEAYECGVETIGGRWNQFNFRYYMFAILFVIFDVEVVFLYPWATKFLKLELFALIEMAVFVAILLVGWAYAWRKQDLEWRS